MAEKDKRLNIDPERFAYAVINNYTPKSEDGEQAAKEYLKRFLTAYFLIIRFNELEKDQFSMFKNLELSKIIEAIDKAAIYR